MTIRYTSVHPDDVALRDRMKAIAHERSRFGYRRIHVLLKREGVTVNHKRLLRLCREEKLSVRKRGGRKRAIGVAADPHSQRRPPAMRCATPDGVTHRHRALNNTHNYGVVIGREMGVTVQSELTAIGTRAPSSPCWCRSSRTNGGPSTLYLTSSQMGAGSSC